jgi:hypothetical protein
MPVDGYLGDRPIAIHHILWFGPCGAFSRPGRFGREHDGTLARTGTGTADRHYVDDPGSARTVAH